MHQDKIKSEVRIMGAVHHEKHPDYSMTAMEVLVSFLIGVAVVGSIWLFTGLLIGLFVL